MSQSRMVASLVGLALCLPTATTLASLATEVDAIRAAQEAAPATVSLLRPRVLSAGATLAIALPAESLVDSARPCTTVTAVGARSTVFGLSLPAPPGARSPIETLPSTAGVASVLRCGAARAALQDLVVEMRSPHAVLELLVARSAAQLPDVRSILPGRDPGLRPVAVPLGPAPAPPPLEVRERALAASWVLDGYGAPERRRVQASPRGAGQIPLELESGCHRLAVLGIPGDGSASFRDLDAELELAPGTTVTDRSEGPDALLGACVGEERAATLSFVGAPPGSSVLLLSAMRSVPAGLPEAIDLDTCATLAQALLRHRAPFASSPPLLSSFGVQGKTRVPLPVERGRCYLAALAPMGRTPRLTSLAFVAGGETSEAHSGASGEGVAVAGCATRSGVASLEIEVLGSGTQWALVVWPASGVELGAGRR